jgi:hypothetical protein
MKWLDIFSEIALNDPRAIDIPRGLRNSSFSTSPGWAVTRLGVAIALVVECWPRRLPVSASSRFADGARRSLVSLQTETSQGLTSRVGEAYICAFWAPVPSDLKRSVHDDQSIHVR